MLTFLTPIKKVKSNMDMKYFDDKNKRLVFIKEIADSKFWDERWDITNLREKVTSVSTGTRNFVVRITKRYLDTSDGPIWEAGCGLGQNVYALSKNGFNCIGVDFAKKTVEKINEAIPEIDIRCCDVRHLDFPDEYFSGIWSLGVIEHFYKGYDDIVLEVKRTLIAGGYFFVTFPSMSLLRRIKSKFGQYPIFSEKNNDIQNFYQFALNPDDVIKRIECAGFKFIKTTNQGGTKGLKDEVRILKPILQNISNSKSLPSKLINYFIGLICSPFAGHVKYMVFKKL